MGTLTLRSLALALIGLSAGSLASTAQPKAHANEVRGSGLIAWIDKDGEYGIAIEGSGWTLEGKLPPGSSLRAPISGTDKIGAYRELRAQGGEGRLESIRAYTRQPLVLFSDHWLKAGSNSTPFPSFAQLPADAARYSFKRLAFSHYEFNALGEEGPWILFKDAHAIVVSPADHFQIAAMAVAPDGGASSGINAKIESLPEGFTHGTLVAAGGGVDIAMQHWGEALQSLGGKRPVPADADPVLTRFGYWTDNGARYYYKFDPKLGYANTLLAVKESFDRMGVPLGYMQLDSWFYPKGKRAAWDTGGDNLPFGEDVYRADPKLFPDGLNAFHDRLGVPLVTHARWVASTSPYRQQYKMSGNVVIDPKFWKETAAYLKTSGVITYEQDWLDHNASTDLNVDDPSAFLKNMAASMSGEGLSVQYCMAPPSDYMASTQFQNLATIRTTDDRFERARWDAFVYDSRFATVLGAQPWADVFMSTETGNLLLATLSGGPVGVGDEIGHSNVENLHAAVRTDGVIVKPDTGLRPLERMYKEDAQSVEDRRGPMLAFATSGPVKKPLAYYLFGYPRQASDQRASATLPELGIPGSAIAYDWLHGSATVVPEGSAVTVEFAGESHDGGTDKTGSPDADRWGYMVVVPANPNGPTVLGDAGKYVMLGKQVVSRVAERAGGQEVTIQFAAREDARTIVGYAARPPQVHATVGKASLDGYDASTKIFRVSVHPGAGASAVFSVRN